MTYIYTSRKLRQAARHRPDMDMFFCSRNGTPCLWDGVTLSVAQVVDVSVIMIMCDVRSALSTMEKCKTEHVNWYTEKTGHRLVMVSTV